MANTSAQRDGGTTRPLSTGEAVRAFYHMNDHPHGYRYVRLLDGPPEDVPEDSATIGLSTGWIPATVAEDWSPDQLPTTGNNDDRVLVRLHGRFADAYHKDPEPVNGMYWRVHRRHIRPMGSSQPQAQLSLLVVRWWDYWNPKNKRSRTYNVANEDMLLDVLEGSGSPHAAFSEGGNYEVHSAFVRDSSDLTLIGRLLAKAMRGQRRSAMYFLWPTQRAAVERRLAGAISESALFGLMGRMESEGVQSCWPHESNLYRKLAGKLWAPRVNRERPDLRVPPTVFVEATKFDNDPNAAADEAIAELRKIRTEVHGPGDGKPNTNPYRGVVKLGFSWMGEDVRPFTGAQELVKVLRQFLDGAQPDAICLVQERIENVVCELRLVCCRDVASGPESVAKELVRMRLHPPRHNGDETFAMASHQTMTPAECAEYAFRGNTQALKKAEQEATRLSNLWLQWFRDEGHGTPVGCRLDFLVSVVNQDVRIWTVELCENGGSLCCLPSSARTAACFNQCLAGDEPPLSEDTLKRFPQPLPPLHVEGNSGTAADARGGTAGSRVVGRTMANGVKDTSTLAVKGRRRLSFSLLLIALVVFLIRFRWRR